MAVWVEKSDCIGCESCLDACPLGAISMRDDVAFIVDKCNSCGACMDSCPQRAIKSDATAAKTDISAFKDVWVVAETKHGSKPAWRSCWIWCCSAAGCMAKFLSTSIRRRFSRPRPAILTAFSMEEWAWVDV